MARMASAADQEEARLQALKSYAVLDTEPEDDFDQVVRLAARVLNFPIAAIALVDRERQWFKASFGLDGARERPREGCFSDHLMQAAGMLLVPDAKDDPRFAAHPMVTGVPGIRFYAGVPVISQEGHVLGALCVMDVHPHPRTNEQDVAILSELVGFVRDKLELRREARRGRALAEQAELVTRLMAAAAEAPDFAGAMFAAAEAIQDRTGALFCHVWRLAMDGTSAVWVGGAGRGAFQEAAYLDQLRAFHLTSANSPVALALVEDEQNWNDNTAVTSLLPAAHLAFRSGVKLQLATPFRLGEDRYVFSLGLPSEPVEREATARMMREATIALRPLLRRHMDEAEGRLFRRLIEISSAGILVSEPPFDEPGPRIIYANPSIQRMTGYSLEELRGRSPRLLFGPATDPDARRRIGEAVRSGLSVNEDVESYRKDGTLFWTALSVTPVSNSQGAVTHFISSHMDITSARDARLEREALTNDLQALVGAMPGVLMRHGLRDDGRWTRTFIAPGVEALTGFTAEEAMRSDWWAENTDPADRPRLLAALRTALAGSQTRVDFSFRRKDGVPIWIRILLRGHVATNGRSEAIGIWSDVTEEYQLAALREARTRELETVIATLPGVLIRGRQRPDGAWYPTQVSPNVTSVTGYSVEEALREGWWAANAASDVSDRAGPGSARLAKANALPTEGEFEFRHRLGHLLWIRCRSRTYQDENGEPQLVSLWDDITVEKRLLLERENLANDLQRLIATMPSVLIRAHRDEHGRWMRHFISPSIETLTGFTPEEARKRGWWADQVDPADVDRLLALQARDGSHTADFRLRHKQGNLIWVHRSVTTHLDSQGREEAISIWSDVTAEKRLLMDREELARDLQAVIEAMPGVMIRKRKNADGAWHTVYVAPGIESVTGYSVAETLDPGWLASHLDDDDRDSLIRQMRGDFTQDQPSMEFRLRHRKGHSIWIRRLARGHVTAQGIPEIISIWIDVSHEKGLAEQLAHSAKLAQLGQLATGMAHELNQPLAAISLAAENAQRSLTRMEDVPERARDKLGLIVALAKRASDIIDHMRIFGRIETGGRGQVFLPEVLHGVESLLGSKLHTEGVRLVMKLPDKLPPVLGKAVPLEQVMINLITNACDGYGSRTPPVAMERRVIEISAHTEGEWITIEVQDAAGGIPEELLPRIFEPFFTTKPVGKGTGLGLSISYGIISDMAGRITAENRNGGCLIRILLPPAPSM